MNSIVIYCIPDCFVVQKTKSSNLGRSKDAYGIVFVLFFSLLHIYKMSINSLETQSMFNSIGFIKKQKSLT